MLDICQEHVERGHLGGYILGGDKYSYYPELWTWFLKTLKPTSVLDIGCGQGYCVKWWLDQGIKAVGIDGIDEHSIVPIVKWDFTEGTIDIGQYDLCWSCEFVEHVESCYIENFLSVFDKCKIVAMTHAFPGQGGYHHVNEQWSKYWINVMESRGFQFDQELTESSKYAIAIPSIEWNKCYWHRSGLIFRNLKLK